MAFPSTPILDNFNRANSGTLGANWTCLTLSAGEGPAITGNLVSSDDETDYSIMYWNVSTFGPNAEVYHDIVVKHTDATEAHAIYWLTDVSTVGALDGYYVQVTPVSGTDTWVIRRYDNGAPTTLGAGFTQEITDGDAIGLRRHGDDIEAWHRTSGVWSLLATRTDATYVGAGSPGFYAPGVLVYRYDNFGGGTEVVVASVSLFSSFSAPFPGGF